MVTQLPVSPKNLHHTLKRSLLILERCWPWQKQFLSSDTYLLGHRFIIRTDQKSLRNLMDQSLQTPEQQEWLHRFLGYDFTIKYKPEKTIWQFMPSLE